jgi:hypothetical protein
MLMTTSFDSADHKQLAVGGLAFAGRLTRYVLALLFAFALCYAYEILSEWWAYFGFTYQLNNDWVRVGACFVAAIPAALLVARPATFAQVAAWFLYVLVFLPCMLVTVMQFSSGEGHVFVVFGSIWLATLLFVLLTSGEDRRIRIFEVPPSLFWVGIWILWAALMTLVLYTFRGDYQIVGSDDIYNQRFVGAGVADNPIVRYSLALLASAINPFLIGVGIHTRRYWISAVGIGSQIALFGTLAAKAVLLSPMVIVAVYMLGAGPTKMRGNLVLVGLLGLFVVTLPLLVNYNPVGGGLNELTSLIYMRTLLISGATFGVYEQFFSIYPTTYFSNNNIISWFVTYPYGDLSVGQAVQSSLIATAGADIGELNASFLATDGIAALGVIGVPVAALLCAFVLRVISKFVPEDRTMLMAASGAGFFMSLSNTSILTSLVTGGGLVLTILVCVAPLGRR